MNLVNSSSPTMFDIDPVTVQLYSQNLLRCFLKIGRGGGGILNSGGGSSPMKSGSISGIFAIVALAWDMAL